MKYYHLRGRKYGIQALICDVYYNPDMVVIQALRRKFLMTAITAIVTLQLANISIDPADLNPGNEDLSINDIESCVEFVLEVVLNRFDAVKECDEKDEQTSQPTASIVLFASEPASHLQDQTFSTIPQPLFNYSTSFFDSLTIPITSPPPKRS
jgi:hypothetical protein